MSLLANVNQPNDKGYYFALDTTPDTEIVSAQGFYATGGTATGPTGQFTAKGNAVAGGVDVFNMVNNDGASQWSMGLAVVPGGANSGNNLAFFSYDDSGAFLSAPMQIIRSSGGVIMDNGLVASQVVSTGAMACDSLTVGDASDAGGGVINLVGTGGVSRVYDGVYNTPYAPEILMTTTDNLLNETNVQNITPARSGLYVFTMEVTASATGLNFANGTAIITGVLQSATAVVLDSYLVCDNIANPTGYNSPGATIPPNTYKKDIVAIVNLQAGTTYSASLNFNTAINLGTSGSTVGGVKFFIQQLIG